MIQFDLRIFFQLSKVQPPPPSDLQSLWNLQKFDEMRKLIQCLLAMEEIRTVYFFKTVSRSNRSRVRMIDINFLNE